MIVVYGIRARLNPVRARLPISFTSVCSRPWGSPKTKRAHRFVPLEREDFYFPGGRTDAYTVIETNMVAGRTADTRKALNKRLFSELEKQLSLSPVDVETTHKQQAPHQWGFRGMTGDEAGELKYNIKV